MYNDATHARCGVPQITVKDIPAHAGSRVRFHFQLKHTRSVSKSQGKQIIKSNPTIDAWRCSHLPNPQIAIEAAKKKKQVARLRSDTQNSKMQRSAQGHDKDQTDN